MTKDISLGIIGVGYWGARLVKKFSSFPSVKVIMVCDVDKKRLFQISRKFPHIQTTIKYEQLLSNTSITGVVVATPVISHYKVTKECLLAGKHVFVEKPLAQKTKEAKELINLASRKKLALMTDYTYLYHPAVQKIKDFINKEKLGKILFIQSVRLGLELFPKGVNVVWDLLPHDASLITFLLGKIPTKVTIKTNALINQDTPDTAFIELAFPGKTVAQVMISWLSPTRVRHFAVGGIKGTLVFDETRRDKLLFFDTRIEKLDSHKIFQSSQKGKTISFSNQEPLLLACQDFVNVIKDKANPISNAKLGLKVTELLESIEKVQR